MKKEYIKKGQMISVRKHLEKAEEVVRKKSEYLSGKREELGEKAKNPKSETKQIMMLVEEAKKQKIPELGELLLALEVNTRQLVDSIKEEKEMVDVLEKDAKGTSERNILKEIDEELEFATHLEHQMNLLTDIERLSLEIINTLDTSVKDKKARQKIGDNLANLNNIATFLLNMINEEEIPQLKLAYNLLELSEREGSREKLLEIRNRFENIQPNVL
ncbi:MAG: hypothetical protein ABIF92_02995 [archaeon]